MTLTLAAVLGFLSSLVPGVIVSLAARLLSPPPVPALDLGVGRHVPAIRHGVEAVCQAFYFVGVGDGFGLGFTAGIVATLAILTVLWLLRAFLRSMLRIIRDAITPSRRDGAASPSMSGDILQ